jgi:hypothetical protein
VFARLSAGKAAALPIMVRLKIAAAAKTDFGLNIIVAPVRLFRANFRIATTRRAIAEFPIRMSSFRISELYQRTDGTEIMRSFCSFFEYGGPALRRGLAWAGS